MRLEAVVFDAYGTLLDVHAAMQRHADALPPDWERISAEWRSKQLEYTWIASLTGPDQYRDFWALTKAALDYVAARHRITEPSVRAALLEAYRVLPAYPDAAPALAALRERGLKTAILSNGTADMLQAAVAGSGLRDLLDAVISVEEVSVFKPDPRVYGLTEWRLGATPPRMAFVSGNAWDAQGAARAGFRVFWCNRGGNPHEYGLETSATTIGGLAELEAALASEPV